MLLTAGAVLTWLLVGVAAGWAAGKVSRGRGYGVIGDLVIGLIGGLAGGVAGAVLMATWWGLAATIALAFAGSAALLVLIRVLERRPSTA